MYLRILAQNHPSALLILQIEYNAINNYIIETVFSANVYKNN